MAGFRVDMSPLERSSMAIGQGLANVGQTIGNSLQRTREEDQQQATQAEAEALMNQVLSGDPEALRELYSKSPQAGQMAAEYIQQQQGSSDAVTLKADQETMQKLFRIRSLPVEQQAAAYQEVIANPNDSFDKTDLPYMDNPENFNSKAVELFGADKAKAMFGGGGEFEQGTGDMSGYSFNPSDGAYSINPNLKAKLDEVKSANKLELKDKITLNKEFTNLTKDTKLIRNTAKDLDKLSKMVSPDGNVSGPSSIAMVFKFMKALDPTSVVRESEFATAENSSGVPENMRNMYNKLMQGGKLGPKQVEEFVSTAKGLANSAIDSSTVEINDYLNTFEDDLSANFRKNMVNRIPKRFDIATPEIKAAAVTPPVEATVTKEQYDQMPTGTKYTIDGVDYVKGQ